jgi:hypothetical protein
LNVRGVAGLSILLAGHLFYTEQAWADSWQNTVTSRVSTEFDTNPSMSPTYPGGVWRALYEPGYMLVGEDGPNELKAGLGFQIERSSNQTLSRNRDSPTVYIDWLRRSEVGEFDISSKYAEIATRNAGVDATGQGLIGGTTRASRILSGSWINSLSERSSLNVDGSYEDVTYKGGGFVNYVTQTGGFKFSYAWSEQSTPFIRVSDQKYVPSEGGSSIGLASALLGLDLKAEDISWILQAGKSKDTEGNTDLLVSILAHYIGPRAQLDLSADHLVLPSGLGGFVNVDEKKISWRYALSDNSNTGFDLDKRINSHSVINNGTSTMTGIWIERDLNSFWKVRTYYSHWLNKMVGVNGAYSNTIGLSLNYANPDF